MSADPLAALAAVDVARLSGDTEVQAEHAVVQASELAAQVDDYERANGLAVDPLVAARPVPSDPLPSRPELTFFETTATAMSRAYESALLGPKN